jgi:hypothetical protein
LPAGDIKSLNLCMIDDPSGSWSFDASSALLSNR